MTTNFSPPPNMKREDGSARYAYVTFLLFKLNASYVPSALLMAHALKQQNSQADVICMATEPLPGQDVMDALDLLFDHVIIIEPTYIPHKRRQERQDRPFLFTRFQAMRLGADGDLDFNYDKVAILDADILPLRNYDALLNVPTPAGIINEKRENFVEFDENNQYVIPDSVYEDGTWRWHRVYEHIPHGHPIPRELTDKVNDDLNNLGIIGALFVVEPSLAEFNAMLDDVKRPEVAQYVGDLFDLPDMQYLTGRWSGQWHNVDVRFCGHTGYPNMEVLFGNHYAGMKPWAFGRKNALKRFGRFPDYQFWYEQYITMMNQYPQLKKVRQLDSLLKKVERFYYKGEL